MDEQKNPKKQKTDTTIPAPITTSTSSSQNNVITINTTNSSPSVQTFKDVPFIKPGLQLMGTCTMVSDGSTFPQIIVVTDRTESTFAGTVLWPTLNSAKTKFKGTISGDNIIFEEYEIINGENDVEVPNKYIGKLGSDGIISGKTDTSDPEAQSTFELKRILSQPSKGF